MTTKHDLMTARARGAPIRIALLGLPGEIRNRIYDFASEDKYAEFSLQHQSWNPDSLCADCRAEPSSPRRMFFGLTQVCRTIRAEYHVLYMARTRINVDFAFVHRYLDTFVLAGGVAPAHAVGNIVLREGQCYHCKTPKSPNMIDMQLILDLNKAAPNLSMKFDTGLHGGFKACFLNPLLNEQIPALFRTFLDHAVSSLEVCAGPYVDVCVVFGIKEAYADRWMYTWTLARAWHDMRGRRLMEEWADAVGLDETLALHYIRFKIDSA